MNEIILFVNHVGQTLLAEKIEDTAQHLKVKNPAILHVTPNQNSQLQVQLIPYFFREFIDQASRKNGAVFTFGKDKIVAADINLEAKLIDQYNRIFSDAPAAQSTGKEPSVVKLFEE